ncbi:MAG TPA: hypothetical protein VIM49_06115 [Dermatophilaceae bacterium]|jgi:hypothetical protein
MSTSIWPRRTPEAVQSRPGSRHVSLVILDLFVGLGGIYGGLEMIRHPLSAFGVTTDLIAGSPFDTFTWPGVLLLVLVGLAPCFLAIGLTARWPGMLQLSGLFGVGLMAWIGVQWALLDDRLWLQPAMFIFGAAIAALALRALRRPDR